tara:strand:+ start:4570 stop:5049 length:480 start_codon:yes stop_codon:yes gene_type:complete
MRFVVPVSNQLALSIAAAHGAADAGRHPAQLLLYGLALLPWSGRTTTAAFAAASVVHFAQDVGVGGSLLLHAAATGLAFRSMEKAVRLMLAYMLAVHIPCLTVVLAAKSRFASVACMLYTIMLFARWEVPRVERGYYFFGHRQQLLVVCHVLISVLFPI